MKDSNAEELRLPIAAGLGPALIGVLLLALAGAQAVAAREDDDPALWPEEQVEFFFDGAALLVDREQREEASALERAERGAWIQEFLDRDPIAETPENELREGIERRRRLVRNEYITLLDHRARVLFLRGPPSSKHEIECGATFNPLEIWHYGERQLVFYQGRIGSPYRLWHPFDSKRSLYNQDMAYWLIQLSELGMKRRIDIKACKDARLVDEATGVEALRGFQDDRPQNADIARFLAPPEDLAQWARQAASASIDHLPPAIPVESIELTFPERRSQRMLTRLMITLPADVELGTFTEEDRTEYRLVVIGVIEQDGQPFDEFRVRFKLPPPEGDTAIALALERALRPERNFLLRFRIEDELGDGRLYASRGFTVPEEPDEQQEIAVPEDVVVTIGEEMSVKRIAGTDSLLLVPPENDLVLGLWRADVLVTGDRIEKVLFLVDGEEQLTRGSAPFSAEVRLARYPREQLVRVEGYDANDELVASDEVSINQPRGTFSVRIVEPRADSVVSGAVRALAEVVIPEERRIEKVEFLLNNELVKEATQAPWIANLEVPAGGETAYLSVTAILDDGSRAEDVRFLNSPQYLEEVEVNFVELLTTVLDNDRRPVPDLESSDFTVLEDGRPQDLAKFELVEDLPLSVGITIDTSGSMAMLLPEAQRAAVEFLRNVITPRDRAFAVSFSKEPVLLIPPTDDVGAVEAALDDLRSLGWTALHDAVVSSLYYFRGMRGRRALILLSDGNDSASFYPFRDAVEYARRSGVVIYTVGLNVGTFQTDIRKKLNVLAKETGGRSFFIDKAEELSSVYAEIERELRSQYLLAYNSDSPVGADSEFRTIEVKVRGGRKARTIAGYYP